MSSKVFDESSANLLSLAQPPKTLNDRFHEVKGEISKHILSIAYGFGLGYTTLAESYDQHNSNLFREIVIEAQTAQRTDETELFSTIAKGNLYEVQLKLDGIEGNIRAEVASDENFKERKSSEIAVEVKRRIRLSAICETDVAGANIVHLAYLFKHYHIGHYLVKRYPRMASQPYSGKIDSLVRFIEGENKKSTKSQEVLRKKLQSLRKRLNVKKDSDMESNMLYTGENILHMTIMRRNYEETRWLLDFYRDHRHSYPDCLGRLLNTDATGKFFDRKGSFYVGSNPLQFAVCSNSIAIFDLVYSFVSGLEESTEGIEEARTIATSVNFVGPDVIFATDTFGNNVLHLSVLHGLDTMYQHVHDTALQVMKRKLHSCYIERLDSHTEGHASHGFTLGCNIEKPEDNQGFRLHEKVLHIPDNAATVKEWITKEARRKVEERLSLALNNDLHSPLTLAASIINKKKDAPEELVLKVNMLRFLVDKTKEKLWEYGPVTMSILNLDGIEIQYDVLQYYDCAGREKEVKSKEIHSAICWLCINDSDKAISIPEVEKLIQAKWERVGYPFFILSFLINTFLTACVTLILIFVNATPSSDATYGTVIAVDVLYAIVVLTFLIMFLQEAHDLLMFFEWKDVPFRGVALYDKVLRIMKILAFVAFCCCKTVAAYRVDPPYARYDGEGAPVLYNVHLDQGIKVSIVVCVVCSNMHLYYYFMGFDSTGPFVLTMFRIISNDVPYFMNFYLIIVVAFGCALSVLSNSLDPTAGYGFAHLIKAIWTLIQNTVGINNTTHDHINNIRDDYPQHLQWLADILLTFYNVIVIILMLNLLIAMISNTYNAYCEYNGAILLIAKYNIMNGMEWVMWEPELKENRSKYAQINELTKLDTVHEGVKVKPPGGSSQKSARRHHAGGDLQALTSYEKKDIDQKTQVKYMFELQTVNHAWYSNAENKAVTADAGKIAEAVAVALGGQTSGASSNTKAANRKTTLFIIDPQVDFHKGGSLAVPSADEDSKRIADMIDTFGEDHIHDIFISMDSHYPCHIAHEVSWHAKDDPKKHPPPFTRITNADVKNGVWVYADTRPEMQDWALAYTGALERRGRMTLTIWPEHCIIGSKGHSVVPVINDALQRWAHKAGRPINYIMKGQNLRVEMYSALQAEVPDPKDQNTGLNVELLSMLKTSDRLLVCGQAMSHCVNYTTRDLIEHWDKNMSSIVLLTDGASPVAGFEIEADEFKRHCGSKGVTLNTIKEAFSSCKPKPPMTAAVLASARAGAKQQQMKKKFVTGAAARANRSPVK